MKLNPAIVKSLMRGIFIMYGTMQTATATYLSTGKSIGLNKETFFGIAIQLALVVVAIMQRYFDKNDNAFGKAFSELLSGKKKR